MSLRKNNHYVPRLYLNNWGDNNRIWVYNLLVPNENVPVWTSHSVERTASYDNLYTRIEDGKTIDDFEEDFNKRFETPASPVIKKACSGDKLTSGDWRILCDFVVAQSVRTPAFYIFLHQHSGLLFEEAIKEVEEMINNLSSLPKEQIEISEEAKLLPLRLSVTNEKPDEEHTNVLIETVIGKSHWLFAMKHFLSDNSLMRNQFYQFKWSIVDAADDVIWPTSDNPLVYTDICHFVFKNNIGQYRTDRAIVFPLSPKKVLIANRKRVFPHRFQADYQTSVRIKNAIINGALFYVYGSTNDESIPVTRQRMVNEEEYQRIKAEFAGWFDQYKEVEAPLLDTQKRINGLDHQ